MCGKRETLPFGYTKMKRVALTVLDSVLVGIWSFLALFILGAAAVFFLLPAKWLSALDSNTIFEASVVPVCWLSTTRFLSYMERPQWVPLVLHAAILLLYLWLSPQKTWLHQLAATAAATWIVVLIYTPLYTWLRPYVRIKWGTKESRHAQKIQRELALRSMATEGILKMKE